MGLRLVAHYFDRIDALVAQSAIEADGMLAFVHGYDVLTVVPYWTGPFGGYRLVVSEFDLDDVVALLRAAQASAPTREDDVLEVRGDLLERVLSLVVGWLAGGAPAPVRSRSWRV